MSAVVRENISAEQSGYSGQGQTFHPCVLPSPMQTCRLFGFNAYFSYSLNVLVLLTLEDEYKACVCAPCALASWVGDTLGSYPSFGVG